MKLKTKSDNFKMSIEVSVSARSIIFLLFFSVFIGFGCRNNRNKSRIKAVIPICQQKLYLEKYEISGGGAHDGDILSAYLTDSVNFRIYLRTYDDAHEVIGIECKGVDSIKIIHQVQDSNTNAFKTVDSTNYSVQYLKKTGTQE